MASFVARGSIYKICQTNKKKYFFSQINFDSLEYFFCLKKFPKLSFHMNRTLKFINLLSNNSYFSWHETNFIVYLRTRSSVEQMMVLFLALYKFVILLEKVSPLTYMTLPIFPHQLLMKLWQFSKVVNSSLAIFMEFEMLQQYWMVKI